MKRFLDLVFAGLLLIAFLPLMAVVALVVLLSLGRPVLFRQTRPGKDSFPFVLVKFRTMRKDGETTAATRFLRAVGLDELPELWNILRGDMSFVGPRPLLMEYLPRYSPEQARRHAIRPGLSGWAQVHGRNALDWEMRLAMDVWYVDHGSFWTDLRILAMTCGQILRGRGTEPAKEFVPHETHGNHEREDHG